MDTKDLKHLRPVDFHKTNNKYLKKINDYISKKSSWKLIFKCPVCCSKNRALIFKKFTSNIYRCNNCEHIYSDRKPNNLDDAYSNTHHQNQSIESYDQHRNFRIKRFAVERLKIVKKYHKNPKLLDYGCGTGWFLEYAKTKIKNIEGFEPTKSLAKIASAKIKINIYSDFNNRKLKKYNVITLFDVIEHIDRPRIFLNKVYQLLEKNGILIIFTPNSKSLSFDYLKEKGNLIIPPLHLQYFNKSSIIKLFKDYFKVISFETKGFDIADIYTNEIEYQKFSFINKNRLSQLQNSIDEINYSNHLRIVLKKKI